MSIADRLMDPQGIAIGLLLAAVLGAVLYRYGNINSEYKCLKNNKLENFFSRVACKGLFWLFCLKLVIGVGYTLIYWIGYEGRGDTFGYYEMSDWIARCWLERPEVALKLYQGYKPMYTIPQDQHIDYQGLMYFDNAKALLFPRLVAPFSLLLQGSFWGLLTLVSLVSAWGHWAIYRVLNRHLSMPSGLLAIAVLALPGVLFWSSGFTRDALAFGCFGLIISNIDSFIGKNSSLFRKLLYGLGVVICAAILLGIKPETALAAVVVGSLAVGWQLVPKSWAPVNRWLARVFVLVIVPALILIALSLSPYPPTYLLEYITLQYNYDIALTVHPETSPLASMEYESDSLLNTLARAPRALWTALYRPLWPAVQRILPIVAAAENFILLIISIILGFRFVGRLVRGSAPKPTVLAVSLLAFCVLYLTFVGLSTANFGSLHRFRIYALPFWYVLLAYGAYGGDNSAKIAGRTSEKSVI